MGLIVAAYNHQAQLKLIHVVEHLPSHDSYKILQ
jgi:hypothetical protein